MKTRLRIMLISLTLLFVLSACGQQQTSTADWKVFAIEEEPAIDIQFRLPPEWYVDYAPNPEDPSEWHIALVPPFCAEEQVHEYEDNCISLTAQIKAQTSFDKDSFLTRVSKGMILNQSQTEESILVSQEKMSVNGIEMQRFDHKILLGENQIAMTIIFFETDSAYYYLFSEFPFEEQDGEAANQLMQLVESIETID